ncbi:MAG TPA: hypothetical protein VMJ64_06485, partial [Anaerolineales bacterium]|nr:hypothetical protein [Anaerolineales bacterium]
MASKLTMAAAAPVEYPAAVQKRLDLFPDTTRIVDETLTIGGIRLDSLASEYGTPLYVYDEATMDAAVAAYQQALQKHYPADAHVTYAGKAFFCKAVAEWIHRQGLWADCTGEGEIRMALTGGLRRESIVAHGVNKSSDDLLAALQHAGTVVADNLTELRKISALRQANPGGTLPDIWLRLLPGVAVATHHVHTQTGQHGSKFGMTPEELVEAVRFCRQQDLPVSGLHFHQGSNFRD